MKSSIHPARLRAFTRLPRLTVLFFGLILMAGFRSQGQTGYGIPINEINIHAFRHFSKNFRTISNEAWYRTDQGYTVTFLDNSKLNRVYYDARGNFLCSVSSYAGTAIDKETGRWINGKFPGYRIDVVTAIDDGANTVFLVTIKNNVSVKTLSVCDGIIEIRDDLVNGG
jgi:hypothetical protein